MKTAEALSRRDVDDAVVELLRALQAVQPFLKPQEKRQATALLGLIREIGRRS